MLQSHSEHASSVDTAPIVELPGSSKEQQLYPASFRSLATPHQSYVIEDPGLSTGEQLGGGALRHGRVPRLLSRESLGLFAQYAAVGLVYGALPGTIYPFLQNYLNVQGTESVAARTLVSIPWSFKVFYGILTDCFPIFGFRRRPYMVLGWAVCLAMLIIMACTPIGEPYFTNPSMRYVKPENYTDAQRTTLNTSAQDQGGKYVVLMMLASVGYLMADVAADAVVVEIAQREPESIRGRTQTAIYTVRTTAMVVANLLLAFLLNGKEYGGDYSFALSFPTLMLVLAVCTAPIVPITLLTIEEEQYESPGLRAYMGELWGMLQTRAMVQIIAYKFFSGLFANFSFVAQMPMQTYWAKVSPRSEKISNIFVLSTMIATLLYTGRYGLNWNWRVTAVVTTVSVVALDAFSTFLVTWDVWRSPVLWLGMPVLEQIPQGVGFIVATYVVVELAEMGHEGAIYGLLTTVSNLSDPFAKTMTKIVNAPFDLSNNAIQNDTHEIRAEISVTLLIMYGMQLLSLAWLPLLPPQKQAVQELRATGGSNRLLGLLTVLYVTVAIIWSVMANLLTVFPSTSCLIIAGGSGCHESK